MQRLETVEQEAAEKYDSEQYLKHRSPDAILDQHLESVLPVPGVLAPLQIPTELLVQFMMFDCQQSVVIRLLLLLLRSRWGNAAQMLRNHELGPRSVHYTALCVVLITTVYLLYVGRWSLDELIVRKILMCGDAAQVCEAVPLPEDDVVIGIKEQQTIHPLACQRDLQCLLGPTHDLLHDLRVEIME